jgi:EAL domain-containing protein (putative c-di-GMP-specific phosphodiesterase class I)
MYLLSRKDIQYPLNTVLCAKDVLKDQENRRILVLSKLRKALLENSFMVYFQPIIDAGTNKIVSAEALLRYKDSELGWISPAEFIPIAEQAGIINSIGDFVMDKSCQVLSAVRANGYYLDYMEINLSPLQCFQNNLAQNMLRSVNTYGLSPKDICFEITETAASSKEIIQSIIQQLILMGFSIAIDDYGTGYSNMLNLLAIDFNYIKFDRSLLLSAENSERGLKALHALTALFNPLNTKIVAEGVETEKQLSIIKTTGIQYIQGYYYSRPLSPDDFLYYLSIKSSGRE